jgi:hypothetical protein
MLEISLNINREPVGYFEVVRMEELKPPKTIYHYKVEHNGKLVGKIIKHRYSDGAITLARKVLEAFEN